MKNNKKYSLILIIGFTLLNTSFVYANEDLININLDEASRNTERKELKYNREENKNLFEARKKEFTENRNTMKNDLKLEKETFKLKIDEAVETIKLKREEFKTKIEGDREAMKAELTTFKENLKKDLEKVKDEKKKVAVENIVNYIQNLNTKTTEILSEKVNQIENVLISIDSRISKAEERNLDVTSAKTASMKAHNDIDKSRESILEQSKKIYEVDITEEAKLKETMKTVKENFASDIKMVRNTVKVAHQSVKDAAIALSKIPQIDDDSSNKEVENSTSENSN